VERRQRHDHDAPAAHLGQRLLCPSSPLMLRPGFFIGTGFWLIVALVVIWVGREDEAVYSAPPEQVTVDLSS